MTMASRMPEPYGQGGGANLADILERVLDKGIVIAGDIRINLLDIELLTIKLRLIVASVDKAKEMGIDWWEDDPALSSGARRKELARENAALRERLARLEELAGPQELAEPEEVAELEPEEVAELEEVAEAEEPEPVRARQKPRRQARRDAPSREARGNARKESP
ncbi:gas vesicle protein [Streptomyces sp. ME08-AFT2]|uniref:gas vesicle protein n=1 Tax=Streptomyces sp. ME08-AFT2 TaxID=3028683 RepID=UPI0029B44335|nr:gas vesicle protein [Streptomyces sp. ME08-AFT2]MDX3312958.1 gas vesicle protein [Streptomyces sp. ME08-AFT2]